MSPAAFANASDNAITSPLGGALKESGTESSTSISSASLGKSKTRFTTTSPAGFRSTTRTTLNGIRSDATLFAPPIGGNRTSKVKPRA